MQLHEKILYCRKKMGLSQEGLAERTGVSRQAVSKWETGEALPEIGKLALLAKVFGVTADWLLSEEEAEGEQPVGEVLGYAKQPDYGAEDTKKAEPASWVDSLPGVIRKLIGLYGWLYGVYVAAAGVGFILIGVLAQVLVRQMFESSFTTQMSGNGFPQQINADGIEYFLQPGVMDSVGGFGLNVTAPFSTFGVVMVGLGVIMVVGGAVLAILLKKKGK